MGGMMKPDDILKKEVEDELRWDPSLKADDIAVAVKDGVVTLTGFVRSYTQRWEAERAVKRVAGVVGVANDIEVRLPIIHERPDPEIARDVVSAILHELPEVEDRIKVIVKSGWVRLEGEVEWNYQRERAERAARRVRGVAGITNAIEVKPRVAPQEIQRQIEEAFKRNAEIDAKRITVETDDGEVVLKGTVRSWAEREEAERIAWSAPGVRNVDNRIVISP
jgi:osmotically-inducible protein OsmY